MIFEFPALPGRLPNLDTPYDTINAAKQLKVDYPKKSPKPILPPNHRSTDVEVYLIAMKEWEADVENYDALKKQINDHNYMVDQLIMRFIWDASGLNSHVPEQYRQKLWDLAWAEGHSDGYCEVFNRLNRLVEIFE